jgi:hypothetical protein
MILHFLEKPELPVGEELWQSMSLLVNLRNKLVHHKSKWVDGTDSVDELCKRFRPLNLQETPFYDAHTMYFPHRLLSAACAA